MELILRLHRLNRLAGRPYRIAFLVNPVCWTDGPESPGVLRGQRIRWQRGLGESLAHNRGLLFHRRGGAAGWLMFPFMVLFELLGPLVELSGYLFMAAGFAFGFISPCCIICCAIPKPTASSAAVPPAPPCPLAMP